MGPRTIPWDECVGFTADDRVKLSYHVDGFAQFSSENPGKIISGRNPKTGEPRGLGLFTHPLSVPIVSGPSLGVTVRGLEEFEKAEENEDLIILEPDDFYYRQSTPIAANGWSNLNSVCLNPFLSGALLRTNLRSFESRCFRFKSEHNRE